LVDLSETGQDREEAAGQNEHDDDDGNVEQAIEHVCRKEWSMHGY
jgi:hypothetical protein